ncbi:MAG: twin-arginine translocase subunit TatC [Alloprevotella sp.]
MTMTRQSNDDATQQSSDGMTFWEHLDELRSALLRTLAVTLATGIVAFCFRDLLFDIVLAPRTSDFITYRWLNQVCDALGTVPPPHFAVSLINTGLAEQFVIHVKTSLCVGVLCASPYILYELFRFVSPALYANERRVAGLVVGSGYAMFMLGVMVSYLLIFPLTFRFLGTYQVSADVANMVTLQSYMSTLIMMCLTLGLVFEMPVILRLLSQRGFVTSAFLRRYRRHAIVIILIVAAVITPTSDVFTLLLVSLPMWLLYEFSILICKK